MKTLLASAFAVICVAAATNAFASQLNATVKHVDRKHDSITLSDGKVYGLPEDIEVESLTPGQKVTVTFSSTKSGKREISKFNR